MFIMEPPTDEGPRLSPLLGMTVADIETLVYCEPRDPLLLWNYSTASHATSRYSLILAVGGHLDKYYYYRRNGYSFYSSDDARPAILNILPGGAGELRREVQHIRDIHAVPSWRVGYYVEVISLHGSKEVPLYAPLVGLISANRPYEAVFVEGLPLPVWVVGEPVHNPEHVWLYMRYTQFVAGVAYWVWQFTPFLTPILNALVEKIRLLQINLTIVPHPAWHEPEAMDHATWSDGELPVAVTSNAETGILEITVLPQMAKLLERPDNVGERHLMEQILRGLRGMLPPGTPVDISDEAFIAALACHAPLGQKKMMLSLRSNLIPEMDPRGLPAYYRVSKSDKDLILDEVGDYLRAEAKLPPGPIPDNQRVDVLRQVVEFLYRKMASLAASLNPDLLLEYLLGHHESIVHEVTEHRLTMPTRLACYSHDSELIRRFASELQGFADAGVSSRFVIEYITACPPRGIRPISLSTYNRLQALADQITIFGFTSDLIQNGVADVKLEMLLSGRLGMDQAEFDRAREAYLPILTAGEASRATRGFHQHWRDQDQTAQESPPDPQLENAAQAEFGFTLMDILIFMSEAMILGGEQHPGLACVPRSEFISRMAERLGWEQARIDDMTTHLTLAPRLNFLEPPAPFQRSDVYPWRFNRRLSYLRKPLLLRKTQEDLELLWGPRHLHGAWEYLLQLCLNGRLQAESKEMKAFLGKLNNAQGEEFNNRVAEFLAGNANFVVRKRFGLSAGLGYPESTLGDIDVLVFDVAHQRVLVIECKDLAVARTPHEMGSEWKKIFEDRPGKQSVVAKQIQRANWVRSHLVDLLIWLKLDSSRAWKVEPLVVVSFELLTPHLRKAAVRVISFEELSRDIAIL